MLQHGTRFQCSTSPPFELPLNTWKGNPLRGSQLLLHLLKRLPSNNRPYFMSKAKASCFSRPRRNVSMTPATSASNGVSGDTCISGDSISGRPRVMSIPFLLNVSDSPSATTSHPQDRRPEGRHFDSKSSRMSTVTPDPPLASNAFSNPAMPERHVSALRGASASGRASSQFSHSPSESLSPVFTCSVCRKKFKERGSMAKHKKMEHASSSRPFACSEPACGAMFSHRDGLTRHSLVHNNIRNFSCPILTCGKRFKQRSHAAKHVACRHNE